MKTLINAAIETIGSFSRNNVLSVGSKISCQYTILLVAVLERKFQTVSKLSLKEIFLTPYNLKSNQERLGLDVLLFLVKATKKSAAMHP